MSDPMGGDGSSELTGDGASRRRAIKVAGAAAVAGAAWVAPTLNGVSLVPDMASAATRPPIATPASAMCFDTTGLGGSNCFPGTQVRQTTFGPPAHQGNVALTVQGCTVPGDGVTTRLADFPGTAHDYENPPGYVCRFELSGDCGTAVDPVASRMPLAFGLAGLIISDRPDCPTGLFNGNANSTKVVCWVVKCDPA